MFRWGYFAAALLTITLLALFATELKAANSSNSLFEEANVKYQAGDFKGAAESYEELAKAGRGTEAVYYNLGNASFRAGRKGKAALFYERALRISPRDEDARWNLAVLRSTLPDRLESVTRAWPVGWIRVIADRFSPHEVSVALTGALLGWVLVLAAAFFFPRIHPWSKVIGNGLVVAAIAAGALLRFQWPEIKDPLVVVLDKEVFARYGPSQKETKAFLLHEGATARVLDESGTWFYISLANKSTGWVPKESCEVV